MKRKLLTVLLVIALALGIAACNGGGSNSPSPSGSSAPSAAKPVEITVALDSVPNALDPISEDIVTTVSIGYHIYDKLVDFDLNFNMIPAVAKSWKQLDVLTWEFEINMDLVFQNGDKITMDDVVYSIERMKNIPKSQDAAEVVESMTYTGNTLTVKLKAPNNVSIPKLLALCIIVNKAYVEANGDNAIALNPIGTGPYKVSQFTPGTTVVIETWDGYPLKKPQIDKITFIPIAENQNRYISVETGQSQYAGGVTAKEAELANTNADLKSISFGCNQIRNFSMNCMKPPFDNANVRLAMATAFDRASFCALDGGRTPAESMLFPGFDVYQVSEYLPKFDLEEAKSILEAEGYNASNPLKFTITYYKPDPGLEFYQTALQSIGVDVSISLLEFSIWLDGEGSGNFTMNWLGVENVAGTPLQDLQRFDSNFLSKRNISYYVNPEIDELIQKAYVTIDENELKGLFKQINDLVAQNNPHIPGFLQPIFGVMDKKLDGVTVRADNITSFKNATYNG